MSPRFCECGGRLRYRDARRYALPGVEQGHRWVCDVCGAVKTRWGAATPEERERERQQSRRSSAKYRARVRQEIEEAKNRPCADCGGRFPTCVTDLDHVRGAKAFKISDAVQLPSGISIEKVRREIAKCDVVCANCHRIRTESRGYGSTRRGRRGTAVDVTLPTAAAAALPRSRKIVEDLAPTRAPEPVPSSDRARPYSRTVRAPSPSTPGASASRRHDELSGLRPFGKRQ